MDNTFDFNIENSVEWLNSPLQSARVEEEAVIDRSFNPYKLDFPSNVIICGVTNSQKTTVALHILRNNYKNFNRILVATTTDDDYKKILDKDKIIMNPKIENIEDILKYQNRHKKTKTLLILDDLIGSVNMGRNNIFDRIASTSRHMNLSVIFIVQHITSISTVIRNNSKYLFVTHVKLNNLQKLYEMVDGFDNFNEFKEFYKEHNDDYVVYLFYLFRCRNPCIVFKVDIPSRFFIKQK